MFARIETAIQPLFEDPSAASFLRQLESALPELRPKIRWARMLSVTIVDLEASRLEACQAIEKIFRDSVLNWLFTGELIPSASGSSGTIRDLLVASSQPAGTFWGIEKKYRGGVTDATARTTLEAFEIVLSRKLKNSRAATGNLLILEGSALKETDLEQIATQVFCNDMIESSSIMDSRELMDQGRFQSAQVEKSFPRIWVREESPLVKTVLLTDATPEQLVKLSQENTWALSAPEMRAIQNYYLDPKTIESRKTKGLNDPTDIEMEIIAQTWSEHCKHKLLGANVTYREELSSAPTFLKISIPSHIQSLFKTCIVGATKLLSRPWLLSVFSDNAGIIEFDEKDALCIKVETHNSPSALDPYGGALTGIVGVNRDILGTGRGAEPVCNMDVFCVGPLDWSGDLPRGLLHPRRILAGIRHGVESGGNKSGIPTVNGALCFDRGYLGKPLVFCGTVGILPKQSGDLNNIDKKILPQDRIVMVGGRVGKDGIHGATFSSLALDDSFSSSVVQLGDPITQKRVWDFLKEARDFGFYRTLTDNGAGGLSSSVGELAMLSNGATFEISKVPLKYPGLKPYEIVISESQERMTCAVPPEHLESFMALAHRRGVEVSDLGEFNTSGFFEMTYQGKCVASIDLHFLHHGLPLLELEGVFKPTPLELGLAKVSYQTEGKSRLLELLSRPNIVSKEWLIRQYDHEVQGQSVIKPLQTVHSGELDQESSPNDAAVQKPKPTSWKGFVLGNGINPKLSDWDPYLMAQSAVDEAIRNVLSVGANFGKDLYPLALVDNYCWPDPLHDPAITAGLVRASFGLKDAALALGAPFISGKDSMKNEYNGELQGKPIRITAPQTILVTALGTIQDIRLACSAEFKEPGDSIYLIGLQQFGLIGSELQKMASDTLRERGGNPDKAVLPFSANQHHLRLGLPNWEIAKRTYSWLGRGNGNKQELLHSVHDVSEGGLLVALSESLFARKLGAKIDLSFADDPWEFSFGEGFHTFIVSAQVKDGPALEEAWAEGGVPFRLLGNTQSIAELQIAWKNEKWSVSTGALLQAWKKNGAT